MDQLYGLEFLASYISRIWQTWGVGRTGCYEQVGDVDVF